MTPIRRIVLRFMPPAGQTFLQRLWHKGFRSAAIFLWCAWLRFYIRVRNRLWRVPRVECPCCGWQGYDFLPLDGVVFWLRANSCPHCRGQERHRMLTLYFARHGRELSERAGRVLHIAPEPQLRAVLAQYPRLRCFSTDIGPHFLYGAAGPAFQSDITRLALRDQTFDVVFCIHVLEHIREDGQALAELGRILRRNGVAYVMAPINMRLRTSVYYGRPHPDIFGHYWSYSLADFRKKLAGFDYSEIVPHDFLTAAERRRYRIPDCEILYRCGQLA